MVAVSELDATTGSCRSSLLSGSVNESESPPERCSRARWEDSDSGAAVVALADGAAATVGVVAAAVSASAAVAGCAFAPAFGSVADVAALAAVALVRASRHLAAVAPSSDAVDLVSVGVSDGPFPVACTFCPVAVGISCQFSGFACWEVLGEW